MFHTKCHVDGIIDKFKARFIAQGFTQVACLDYYATFSLIQIILSLVFLNKWPFYQLDVKNIF